MKEHIQELLFRTKGAIIILGIFISWILISDMISNQTIYLLSLVIMMVIFLFISVILVRKDIRKKMFKLFKRK